MKNTPKSVLIGWTSLAFGALAAYTISKNYTLEKLRNYTRDGSVTSSRGDSEDEKQTPNDGVLRRSVDRRL
ncbi:hypothetical protein K501DRAFT_282259 [Backusella circina FSU 941]|nr:hypothetical protein K501DRAFT_282259 [Backusella circina FSU 941]